MNKKCLLIIGLVAGFSVGFFSCNTGDRVCGKSQPAVIQDVEPLPGGEGMTFDQAFETMKNGARISRVAWEPQEWVTTVQHDTLGNFPEWQADSADRAAEDWFVVK